MTFDFRVFRGTQKTNTLTLTSNPANLKHTRNHLLTKQIPLGLLDVVNILIIAITLVQRLIK